MIGETRSCIYFGSRLPFISFVQNSGAQMCGTFVLRGTPVEILEGTPSSNRLVVSEWPSLEAARAYYHSSEYAAAKTLRQGGVAEAEIMLFEGV